MHSDFNIEFEKFHGASNDFIFISDSYLKFFSNQNELKKFAEKICDRNQGIGADGVVFYQYPLDQNTTLVNILIINSDGSFAGTCGNALRCLGLKLIQDKKWDGLNSFPIFRLLPAFFTNQLETILSEEEFILQKNSFAVLTKANVHNLNDANVSVAMGKEIEIFQTPIQDHSLANFGNFENITPIFVSLSNPHWVFISSEFLKFNKKMYEEFGHYAQNDLRQKALKNKIPLANIGMLSFHEKNVSHWNLVVYERGAGLTACCGSGGVAARIALEHSLNISTQLNEVFFKMPGGIISISKIITIENYGEQRILSGPSKKVFSGNIPHYLFQ
ncbi:hypothetical protein GCL60_01085 [Silvanigrella paludirubra]|uniref:diaminopimelate epimerase n=1 Tax=Silvanigrella paludirubra TaxID=2499159 RepID=A0A6N6VW43_9BACT|nr:hypothetical protein [Silvanigrella paludirubra]KAB8040541.1 hypothetical protein GCL60_01085 [Silvanigrella paludirubra]